MKNKALVLAVDIGTSSVRAMAFNVEGGILGRTQISYPAIRPQPYFEEQDPLLVRAATYDAIARLLSSEAFDPKRIAGLSFSSQMYSIMALDGADNPLTNSILWSDGRAEAQAAEFKRSRGAMWLYPSTGCPMNSIYPIAKLAWIRERLPEVFKNAKRFVSIKEFVTRPLTGEWTVDYSMASASGMFDIAHHCWHPDALRAAGIDASALSTPVSGTRAFRLMPDSPIAKLGLGDEVAVFLGGGDGPLANIGSGASRIGAINIDLGTSGAARCTAGAPTTDASASLWCFCLTEALWTYGGIVTNVGNSYQWLATTAVEAGGGDLDAAFNFLNRQAATVSAGSDGLLFMPYLRKARSPYWDDKLRGTLYGLTPDHGYGHVARALLEAVAYDLKTIIGLMDKRITTTPEILLTGGLSRSPIMPQLLADVLGRKIAVPEQNEGSIAGAAILGFSGLDLLDDLMFRKNTIARTHFEPNPDRELRYQKYYRNYIRLVEALRSADIP